MQLRGSEKWLLLWKVLLNCQCACPENTFDYIFSGNQIESEKSFQN